MNAEQKKMVDNIRSEIWSLVILTVVFTIFWGRSFWTESLYLWLLAGWFSQFIVRYGYRLYQLRTTNG